MLLFRRIFNFEKAKVAQMENRLNTRYAVGPAFPLQVLLSAAASDWQRVKVQNISGNGIGVLVARGGVFPVKGDPAKIQLVLADHRLDLEARLVHVQPRDDGISCGLGFVFADFLLQKAYLQFLQPIALGQSLQPVPADRVIQNEPQFIKQVYRGESDSVLTVWLGKTMGTPVHSFEFQMHEYFCRAELKTGVLEAYAREAADSFKGKRSNPVFDTTGGLQDEIRQLFRWIVPNLSSAIPDDIRAVLKGFTA